MIYFQPENYQLSTKNELEQFMEWVDLEEMEQIFDILDSLIQKVQERTPDRPIEVNIETLMLGLGDCLILGETK